MTLWKLLRNDHANITAVGHAVLRTPASGGGRNRHRLVAELSDEIEAHFEAEEDTLFEALEDDQEVRDLVSSLKAEHKQIEDDLARLAEARNNDGVSWTSRFADFTYRLDRHFHREEHELFPEAEALLSIEETDETLRRFIEEKGDELRARRRNLGIGQRRSGPERSSLRRPWCSRPSAAGISSARSGGLRPIDVLSREPELEDDRLASLMTCISQSLPAERSGPSFCRIAPAISIAKALTAAKSGSSAPTSFTRNLLSITLKNYRGIMALHSQAGSADVSQAPGAVANTGTF
ncbi:hemerythrin domain-containing protein [Micromonospora sp. STR1s_5]|nr:hemerythrin domain-containing protein [Micromonospora sp. STR1s_5]